MVTPNQHEQLIDIRSSLEMLLPEWLLMGVFLFLIIGSLIKKIPSVTFFGTTLVALMLTIVLVTSPSSDTPVTLMGGMLRQDDFSSFFKILIALGGVLTLLIDTDRKRPAEYYVLLLSAIIGCQLLVMSTNLLMVLVSLELISIPSYILATGLSNEKKNAEAAWKYFLYGSAATAMMVFGMSYLFGISGTLYFAAPEFLAQLSHQKSSLLLVGVLLTMSGLLFKITAAPFHLWAPDVYEATPTPLVAFFSVVPKLAGFALLAKFMMILSHVDQSTIDWSLLIGIIAFASLLIGTFGALMQTNAKRMMAYSSIAQSGFLLVALTTLTLDGLRTGLFYSAVYLTMNFLTFLMLIRAEKQFGSSNMKTFSGWGYSAIVPAICLLIGFISLIGLPPTGGFMAKLLLFSALWGKFQDTNQFFYAILFGTGLLTAVVSLFFYLKIPFYTFIRTSEGTTTSKENNPLANLLGIILVIVLLYLFFSPALLMGWVNKVNFVL